MSELTGMGGLRMIRFVTIPASVQCCHLVLLRVGLGVVKSIGEQSSLHSDQCKTTTGFPFISGSTSFQYRSPVFTLSLVYFCCSDLTTTIAGMTNAATSISTFTIWPMVLRSFTNFFTMRSINDSRPAYRQLFTLACCSMKVLSTSLVIATSTWKAMPAIVPIMRIWSLVRSARRSCSKFAACSLQTTAQTTGRNFSSHSSTSSVGGFAHCTATCSSQASCRLSVFIWWIPRKGCSWFPSTETVLTLI